MTNQGQIMAIIDDIKNKQQSLASLKCGGPHRIFSEAVRTVVRLNKQSGGEGAFGVELEANRNMQLIENMSTCKAQTIMGRFRCSQHNFAKPIDAEIATLSTEIDSFNPIKDKNLLKYLETLATLLEKSGLKEDSSQNAPFEERQKDYKEAILAAKKIFTEVKKSADRAREEFYA